MSGTSNPKSQEEVAREANKEWWEEYDEGEGRGGAADRGDEEESWGAASESGDEEEGRDDAAETGEETTDRTEGDSGGNPEEAKKKRKAKRPRADRRPQVLANITDPFTLVSESGLPLEPSKVAKGYAMQLGCIVRETVPLNTQDLRSEANAALAATLLQKLHQRYTFPQPFNKKVDSLALTKMSTALSSWKTRLKDKIKKGKSWEQISRKDPSLSREDFEAFKSSLETDEAKKWTAWGKKMRELNLGAHRCGSGGYRGKQPTWDKEDAEMIRLGKENPWLKIADIQTRNYVRSRYYLDWETGEFVTDYPDVKKFEKLLVRIVYIIIALILLSNEAKWANLKFLCLKDNELKGSSTAGPSSQGSTEPWDTPFNRATNAYKERDLDKPPTSAGRVSGFGTSMKVSEYYGSDAKSRKERRSTKDKAEVQELKKKVESLEKIVDPTEMSKLVDEKLQEKLRQIIPPGLMEGLAAWNAAGQQGPIYVPSVSGSNSSHQVSPLVTPTPPLHLVASTPPTAEADRVVVPDNALESERPGAGTDALVSTLAEINAVKKVTH